MTTTDATLVLQRLLDEAACREVVLAAARAVDDGDIDALAALFAVDAVLLRPGGAPLEGREAIRASYAGRDPERLTRHLVSNQSVTLQGPDRARAWCAVLLWSGRRSDAAGARGRPADATQLVGEMADELVRTAEGWRIARREASFRFHRDPATGA